MQQNTAFIFDMDGTMLNNMQFHLQAWEKVVTAAGSDLRGDRLFPQLYGKNSEVLERIFGKDAFSPEEINRMALEKDALYRELYKPFIELLPGLEDFLKEANRQGIKLAIATAAVQENIDFAVDALHIRSLFSALISEREVKKSKPDPETFLVAARELGMPPSRCIVFEDVPKGVEAARRAGMKAVVVLTSHNKEEFDDFGNVLKAVHDFTKLKVHELTK
jgi:beta-phosphoglucomutase family hydrolase